MNLWTEALCRSAALTGKVSTRSIRHDFTFRRLLTCKTCGYSLIGERQKEWVYYRCHTRTCPRATVREDTIDEELERLLLPLAFAPDEQAIVENKVLELRSNWNREHERLTQTAQLNLDQIESRLTRLMDAFLDGSLEKPFFEERKAKLLLERTQARERLAELQSQPTREADRLSEFLELANTAYIQYKLRKGEEKRELVRTVTSNRQVEGKKLDLRLSPSFYLVANRLQNAYGAPERDIPRSREDVSSTAEKLHRIWEQLLKDLIAKSERPQT